jgi:Holliday junction DNA helicase RuvA
MIGYIKGNLLFVQENTVILENNGVGYEINCSSSALNELLKNGKGVVYTYTAVREDGIFLYGFISPEEKNMFLKLISVSGVGPKMGITVLSSMSIEDLAVKIAMNDVKGLSSVKGLGKKTAERIILELREKVDAIASETPKTETISVTLNKDDEDAVFALMSLGFNKQESLLAVKKAREAGADSIEKIISIALKNVR